MTINKGMTTDKPVWTTFHYSTTTLTCFTLLHLISSVNGGIDCFKCVSINGDNPACDDPFHNNYTSDIYESPCMGGRKGRNGLFPATACIKMNGIYDDTRESMTVRGCALDSGTLTTDTELIRMSHCGGFYFGDRYVRGCVQSCDDAEGCNSSTHLIPMLVSWLSTLPSTPWRTFVHCQNMLLTCILLQMLHYGIT
uniref:Protein sleepless n=2 Tax=Cacopsylla melanoneura TaxID=428564 RepID=A0A8D9AGJ5_9HEMI